jgi:hypothetical protein
METYKLKIQAKDICPGQPYFFFVAQEEIVMAARAKTTSMVNLRFFIRAVFFKIPLQM